MVGNFEQLIYILIIVLEIVYGIFAFIMMRQVKLMNTSFNTSLEPIFKMLAKIHFVATVLLIIGSLILI